MIGGSVHRFVAALAAAIAFHLWPSLAYSADTEGTADLCLSPVYAPDRYTTIQMGYARSIGTWSAENTARFGDFEDRFWKLRLPDDFVINVMPTMDRPGIPISVTLQLLYPEMLPTSEVEEELEHLRLAKFGPFRNKAGLPSCQRRGPVNLSGLKESRSERSITITLQAPAPTGKLPIEPEARCQEEPRASARPVPALDFDGLFACHVQGKYGERDYVSYYGKLDNQPFALTCPTNALACTAGIDLNTWPIYVSFYKSRLSEWQGIIQASQAFLASVTQSKSEPLRLP